MTELIAIAVVCFAAGFLAGILFERYRYARSEYAKHKRSFDKEYQEVKRRIKQRREAQL